jgi:hypothetical protein
MKRRFGVVFISILAASLFYPGFFTIIKLCIGDINKRSEAENRLLTIPLHVTSVRGLGKKCRRIEELLEDQLAIRDSVRMIYNRMMVFGFRRSNHRNIVLGENGYWFNVGHRDRHLFRFESAGTSLPKFKIDQISRTYQRLDLYLEKNNMISAIFFVPTKPYLQSRNLPGSFRALVPAVGDKSITRLVGAMRRKKCRAFYPFEIASSIPEDILYHRRIFHWNGAGAQQLLYRQFSKENPFVSLSVQPLPCHHLKTEEKKASFDIAMLLGLGPLSYREKLYRMPYEIEELEGQAFNELRKYVNSGLFLRVFESTNENGCRALLVSDSFGWGANNYIPYLFQSTAFVNTNGIRLQHGVIQDMAHAFSPDAIIFILNENHVSDPQWLIKLFSIRK